MLEHYGLKDDPLENFTQWYATAAATEPFPVDVMSIATVDADGRPSIRSVLLKEIITGEDPGFCFYTNYESRKGNDLADNQRIAALFYWPKLYRQIRIEGVVEKLPRAKSEAYFHSRPRESQISATVSMQSRPITGRAELEIAAAKLEQELKGKQVPLPSCWGGYKIMPVQFEFWQGLPGRMHDRVTFKKEIDRPNSWTIEILAP